MREHCRHSAKPLGRQDHAISPSVSEPIVTRPLHVHRIPHHVRDDAYAPRVGAGCGRVKHEFRKYERTIFLAQGLDKAKKVEIRKPETDLPVGPNQLQDDTTCTAVVPAKAGTHTAESFEGPDIQRSSQQLRPGVIGPGLRRDDVEDVVRSTTERVEDAIFLPGLVGPSCVTPARWSHDLGARVRLHVANAPEPDACGALRVGVAIADRPSYP